tara:strand:- start:77992 stop:78750 length:759 start_codon:yes stop_codon:yes gene_type:complete
MTIHQRNDLVSQTSKVLAIVCLMALPAMPLAADSLSDFNAKVSEAYSGYRAAMNYLRTGNPGLASLELGAAVDSWQSLESTYKSAPPTEFAKDGTFAPTLSKVGKALNNGLDSATDGDMKAAQALLLPVRRMLYELRQRNGVRVYADCITDMNTVMDRLYVFRRPAPELGNAEVRAAIATDTLAYQKLVPTCRAMAPAGIQNDIEFVRLFDGAEDSVASLLPDLDARDSQAVVNVLRELRSFDRILFFRFGG